jgi:hypothetical protein
MKKKIIISLFLIVIAITGNSQEKSGFGFYTDRDVYVSGETMFAKIFSPEGNPARIIYLDLVNKYGTRVCGVSLEIRNNQADGFLQLPDSLGSGNYLARAYLKNTSGKLKILREVWISNRFDGLEKTSQMKRIVGLEKREEKRTGQIEIENLETTYQANSNIEAVIKIEENFLNEIDGNLLVSIAQTEPSFDAASFIWSSDQGKEGITENKGITLSGTVTDRKTLEPVAGITVYLTIPDSVPGFQYYQTRKDGRFYFLLEDYFGAVQAVVQCFGNTPAQRLKITLDGLFADAGTLPEFSQQPIPEEFKHNISRNIDVLTFRKIFSQDKLKLEQVAIKQNEISPYYGNPTRTVDPQLFIDLPNFTEISRELLPGVKFRNYNNEPTLQVINNNMHNYFSENPLILIDGIPIRDLNVIKDMGTTDIDRVEICQYERYYGDLRFPGVVAIYTTKADYSLLPTSDQLIRMDLETIQVKAITAENVISESNIPDLRQLIYWNPLAEPKSAIFIKCNASAIAGQFKLIVRGRLKNGTLIFAEKQFEVK